jgi:hypothetical protein
VDAFYTLGAEQTFKAGKRYAKTFNTAVFGPRLTADDGLFREGDDIFGLLPLFADGSKHAGSSDFTAVTTTLYRNGTEVGSHDDPLFGEKAFKVPAGDAEYRLTTSVRHSAEVAAASTRIDASWTFHSRKPSGDALVEEGRGRERQDHRPESAEGEGDLLPREDHRQEGQQVDDLDLQRVLRKVSRAV